MQQTCCPTDSSQVSKSIFYVFKRKEEKYTDTLDKNQCWEDHLMSKMTPSWYNFVSLAAVWLVSDVTRSLHASNDCYFGNCLWVFGQTQSTHEVYKGSGEVEPAAKLTCSIVVGERMVVVMEAFSWKAKRTWLQSHNFSDEGWWW